MKTIQHLLLLAALLPSLRADAALPPKDKFRIVVLAGQSNMAGRGVVTDADKVAHPRVLMLNRKGEWVPCVDPIHYDVPGSGVGPGKAFAEALAESDPSITVGVVPCAVGGSPIAVWEPGKSFYKGKDNWHPYDDCVARVKRATQDGTLAAILWHQGESDCMRRGGYLYQARFPVLIDRLRKDIGAEGVPLIVGGLAQKNAKEWFGKILSNSQRATCEFLYGPGKFVPSLAEYQLNPDGIHLTRDSQVDFGKRYFAAWKEVREKLAADPQYWKKQTPPKELANAYPIPDEQLPELAKVPLTPEIERYLFPKGVPEALKKAREAADPANTPPAQGWKDPKAGWAPDAAPHLSTSTREKISLNGFWAFGVEKESAALDKAPAVAKLPYFFKVPGKWPTGGKARNGFGVWDAQGRDHFGVDVESVSAAWYARPVEIPAAWKGRRILLTFDAIPSAVLVFVDGKKAGEAFFPGGEVDLTAFLVPGRHELALFTSAKLPETLVTAFDAPDTARTFTKKSIENRGIFGDVALAAEPMGVRITDVQARPSVAKKRIDFSVGLSNVPSPLPALSAEAVVLDGGKPVKRFTSGAVQPGPDGRFVFGGEWADPKLWDLDAPGNLYTVRLALRTADGKVADELYPDTFGFREIRIEGRNLLLNGTPIHLRPRNSVYAHEGAVSVEDCREAMRLTRAFGFNAIVFHKQVYGYSEGDTAMLDMAVRAASDEGLACILCMPHPNRFDDPKNPHHWTYGPAYERLVRHLVRRFQNVPGVLLWSSTHNQTGYESDQNPALITGRPEDIPTGIVNWRQRFRGLALKANEIVGSMDPTRPLYHHESGAEGTFYTLNCYLDWAPIQERSDWFENWEKNGVMPLLLVEWGLPHQASWSSFRGGPKSVNIWSARDWTQQCWMNEYNAAFLGEDAFRGTDGKHLLMERHQLKVQGNKPVYYGGNFNDVLMNEPDYHKVLSLYASRNLRDIRARGVTSILPWDIEYEFFTNNPALPTGHSVRLDAFVPGIQRFGAVRSDYATGLFDQAAGLPRGVALATRDAWADQLGWIAGPVGDFTSVNDTYRKGETVKKSLVILNDTRRPRTVAWRWAVPEAKAGKDGTVTIAPGGRADIPVEFALPGDLAGDTVAIRAAFRNADGPDWTAKDSFALRLLPALATSHSPLGTSHSPLDTSHSPLATETGLPPIFVYDPEGTAKAMLTAMGVPFTDATADNIAWPMPVLLVLGRRSLAAPLPDMVANAARMSPTLVLEQDTATLRKLGFRVQEHGLRNLFALDPALAGLDLTDWRGRSTLLPEMLDEDRNKAAFPRWDWDGHKNTRVWRAGNRGMVAGVLPEKPAIGDFVPLVHGGFDLQYAPVMAYMGHGSRIVFSQLDICGRTERSPEAEEALAALLRISSGLVSGFPSRKIKVLEGSSGKAAAVLGELRFPVEKIASASDAKPGDILVVGPGAKAGPVEEAVKGGLNVLALGLTSDEANALLPGLGAKKCGRHEYPAVTDDLLRKPVFRGVSNADLQWLYPVQMEGLARFGDDMLATRQIGNGHVVFSSIVPWAHDEKEIALRHHRRRAYALVTRLLCNLGTLPNDDFLDRAGGVNPIALYVDKSLADDDPYRYYRW